MADEEMDDLTEMAREVEEEHSLVEFEGFLRVIEKRLEMFVAMANRVSGSAPNDKLADQVFVDIWQRSLEHFWSVSPAGTVDSLAQWASENGWIGGADDED